MTLREDWPQLAVGLLCAWLTHRMAGPLWALPLWLGVGYLCLRQPARAIPQDPKAVLSPADGRIIAIEPAHDPYLNRAALRFSVFPKILNAHRNRSPIDGEVRQCWLAGDSTAAGNHDHALHLRAADGHDVTCVQCAGPLAHRLLRRIQQGVRLMRGERYGQPRLGGRIDLYLPPGSRARVTIGDKVSASSTILAELP